LRRFPQGEATGRTGGFRPAAHGRGLSRRAKTDTCVGPPTAWVKASREFPSKFVRRQRLLEGEKQLSANRVPTPQEIKTSSDY
jgi:hypothetical protein